VLALLILYFLLGWNY